MSAYGLLNNCKDRIGCHMHKVLVVDILVVVGNHVVDIHMVVVFVDKLKRNQIRYSNCN